MAGEVSKKIAHFEFITKEKNIYHPFVVFNNDAAIVSPEDIRRKWAIIAGRNRSRYISLYIHIPYCRNKKCNYCMYGSRIMKAQSELDCYLDYLNDTLEYFDTAFHGYEFANMHIGGGTPTLLDNSQLTRLFGLLAGRCSFRNNAMQTFEVSPSSVTRRKLATARGFGINRISIGAQSFNREALKQARRNYVPFENFEKLCGEIDGLGFETVNVDLIGGLPGDTPGEFRESFIKAASLGPSTITIYFFRFENSRYSKDVRSKAGYGWGEGAIRTFMDAVYDTAVTLDYVNESYSTERLYNVFARSDYVNRFEGYATRWEPGLSNSCFGVGIGARSFILDVVDIYDKGVHSLARYSFDEALKPENLSFGNTRYLVHFFDNRTRITNYFLREMYVNKSVSINSIKRIYKVDLTEYFREAFDVLSGLGKLSIENDRVSFVVKNEVEWGVYSKFFYDPETIERMTKSKPAERYISS